MLLVVVQIYLGALVAGLDAGLVYNTWPQIDGALIPSAERLWFETPLWRNLFENTLTVQFNHRMAAYLLWIVSVWHAVDAVRARASGTVLNGALTLACLMTLQAGHRHRHAAASDAAAARAAAPGDGHPGADGRGDPCRTAVVAPDQSRAAEPYSADASMPRGTR